MDYNCLTTPYWNDQLQRLKTALTKIVERGQAVSGGRVIPDDDSLAIGTGRHVEAAIMFIDISAFSDRLSNLIYEQETNLRILTFLFTELIRIIEDYGGVVEKNTGDGLLAYFRDNDGTPPEVGCNRAIAAALTMFYVHETAINPVITSSGIEGISFRISIDYGGLTIAKIGAPKRFSGIVAIGTRANVSSKMLRKAEPGEIVIGEDVVAQLPLDWRLNWVRLKIVNAGWYFIGTGRPYRLYTYTGRWTGPISAYGER